MRFRVLVLTVVWGLLAAALGAEAEKAGKVYRVALILTSSPISEMAGPEPANPGVRGFVRGLRDLGCTKGRSLILERGSAEGRFELRPQVDGGGLARSCSGEATWGFGAR